MGASHGSELGVDDGCDRVRERQLARGDKLHDGGAGPHLRDGALVYDEGVVAQVRVCGVLTLHDARSDLMRRRDHTHANLSSVVERDAAVMTWGIDGVLTAMENEQL